MKFNIHIFSCEKILIHCVLVSCYGNARPYNPLCFVVNNNGATATNNTFLCDSKTYSFAGAWLFVLDIMTAMSTRSFWWALMFMNGRLIIITKQWNRVGITFWYYVLLKCHSSYRISSSKPLTSTWQVWLILHTSTLQKLAVFYSIPLICLARNCFPCKTNLKTTSKQTYWNKISLRQ